MKNIVNAIIEKPRLFYCVENLAVMAIPAAYFRSRRERELATVPDHRMTEGAVP